MILSFSVDNFLSFDTRQELSMEATADNTSEDSLVVKVKHPKSGTVTRLLRLSVIYGANASGKTNLLYALADVWAKLYQPFTSKDDKIDYRPFAMRHGENTKMEITFFIGGIRYDYSIEYNGAAIVKELLEFNPKGVASLFYERRYNAEKNMPEISFGKNLGLDTKTASTIVTNTLNNHSVLATYNKISVNAPEFEKVVSYIRHSILPAANNGIPGILHQAMNEQPRKDFLLQAIKEADFNICNIVSLPYGDNEQKIEFVHTYNAGHFTMPVETESAGTLQFVGKMNLLYDVLRNNRLLMADELDDSLHHDLLVFFIQTFLANESEAQLLFTVHDQLILSEDFMRRDMAWFTDKDRHSASTELFSADDFNLHKNASIFNAYKTGKLGARPQVGSPFLKLPAT